DELRTLDYKSLDSQNFQLNETVTALQEQLDHFKAENEKVKQHYQELFNSIKVTRVKTIERKTSLQTKIENLKTQFKGKMPCVTNNAVTPKVSAIAKYAIEVESISASLKNNRNIHHHYLNRLRDILDTLREIELLANVRASCPKENEIMNDRTSTAKSVPKKKVEDHIRNTKSNLHNQNRVDSRISLKRTKATGKLFANVGYQWKPTRRKFTLGEQCPLTRITKPKVVHVRQWKPTSRIIPLGEQCPVTRSIVSTSAPIVVETQAPMVPIVPDNACTNQLDPNSNWGSGTPNSPFLSVFKCSQPVPRAPAVHDPVSQLAPPAPADHVPYFPAGTSASLSIEEDAPSTSISSYSVQQSSSVHQGVAVDHTLAVNPFAPVDDVPFVNIFAPDPSSEATSFGEVSLADPNQSILPHEHLRKWTNSH
ncbi:hypothetical protein Tco_1261170, partial [Tanacetum coccineum]